MRSGEPKDVPASIRQRLLNLAKERREDFTFILIRYGLERLLVRLSQSEHADGFVLKGAMLFSLWSGSPHRATKDMDLLGYGSPDLRRLERVFREIAAMPGDDGITFLPETVSAIEIREDAIYDGIRVTLQARLGAARLALQVDVGFGDVVTPAPVDAEYPTLLPMPAARLRVYPREAVIAEKLHAMVDLGIANSRMKDFYDIWFLSGNFEFDEHLLGQAVAGTFARRGTSLPTQPPLALTDGFALNQSKQLQWSAFVARARLAGGTATLPVVIQQLSRFAKPLFAPPRSNRTIGRWTPAEGWSNTSRVEQSEGLY